MTEKDKSVVLLEYYLKKLKLPTMLREYAAVAAVCRKDRSDFPVYLLRLGERELLSAAPGREGITGPGETRGGKTHQSRQFPPDQNHGYL
jgi:hypothetical protein